MQGLASRLGRWWPGRSSPGLGEAALPPGPRRWPPHPVSPGVPEAGMTWPHCGPCPVIPDSRPGQQRPGAELLGCRAGGRGAWTVCRPRSLSVTLMALSSRAVSAPRTSRAISETAGQSLGPARWLFRMREQDPVGWSPASCQDSRPHAGLTPLSGLHRAARPCPQWKPGFLREGPRHSGARAQLRGAESDPRRERTGPHHPHRGSLLA